MQTQAQEAKGGCGSRHKSGVYCLLDEGHESRHAHCDDGVTTWDESDVYVEAGAVEMWDGYRWDDVLAIRDRVPAWSKQVWRPAESGKKSHLDYKYSDEDRWAFDWECEEYFRGVHDLRRPSEPDYKPLAKRKAEETVDGYLASDLLALQPLVYHADGGPFKVKDGRLLDWMGHDITALVTGERDHKRMGRLVAKLRRPTEADYAPVRDLRLDPPAPEPEAAAPPAKDFGLVKTLEDAKAKEDGEVIFCGYKWKDILAAKKRRYEKRGGTEPEWRRHDDSRIEMRATCCDDTPAKHPWDGEVRNFSQYEEGLREHGLLKPGEYGYVSGEPVEEDDVMKRARALLARPESEVDMGDVTWRGYEWADVVRIHDATWDDEIRLNDGKIESRVKEGKRGSDPEDGGWWTWEADEGDECECMLRDAGLRRKIESDYDSPLWENARPEDDEDDSGDY